MTEVMPETPMKIQEEIKAQDGFEHLIKILDISEQNVNKYEGVDGIPRFRRYPPNSWSSLQRSRWKDGQI